MQQAVLDEGIAKMAVHYFYLDIDVCDGHSRCQW